MKNYQNIIDQYEQYLDGELDEAAKIEIEDAIANDENLAEILDDHKLLLDGIKYSARKKLKSKLEEWDTNMADPVDDGKAESKTVKLSWYYVAASVALFAVSIGFFYQYNINKYQRIASNHYSQYEFLSYGTRGGNADSDPIDKIKEQYQLGQYTNVIDETSKPGPSEKSEEIEFIRACSFMATEKYDDAVLIYKDLSETSNRYKFVSKWYLALGYLFKNEPDQAIPILKELAAEESAYSSKALKTLDDLK